MKISDFDTSTLAKILADACNSETLCPMSNETDESTCPFKGFDCKEIRMADWLEILNMADWLDFKQGELE